MVHRLFYVLGDVLRHSQPHPPLGQRLLPADAPVPALFRRRFRAYLDGDRPFAAAHFCAGTHFALCMTVAPWCLTGFIHLDGFMDCCDAVLSRREQARRREILKDSHVGSFAVICLVLLAMAGYSVWLCPGEADRLWALPLVCAGARCVSVGAVLGLKPLETSGYHAMGQSRGAAATAWALGAVFVGLGVLVSGWGFLPPAMAIFVAAVTAFSLRRNLGGMCGDISGAAITLGEMAGCAALLLL